MVSHNHTKYLYFLKLEMSVLHSALIKQATTLSEAGMTQIIILWKQTVIIKNRVEKKKTSLIRIHPFSCPDSQLPSGLLAEAFFFLSRSDVKCHELNSHVLIAALRWKICKQTPHCHMLF